jgi:hypothetical protein
MPKDLAHQWFPFARKEKYMHFSTAPELTRQIIDNAVADELQKAPSAEYTDTQHHPVALSTCMTVAKHLVATKTGYPLYATTKTE